MLALHRGARRQRCAHSRPRQRGLVRVLCANISAAIDWEARRKQRVLRELQEATARLGRQYTVEALQGGLDAVEALIPGFQVDLERLKARDWAALLLEPNAVAVKLVCLKSSFPTADLARILGEMPRLLLDDVAKIQSNAAQVHKMLEGAADRDRLVSELPLLMDPRLCLSILVTVDKWYFKKKDPIAVLEADPDLIRRAQASDIPLEPVYTNDDGSLSAPSLNYKEKRTDWQRYIDTKVYKQLDDGCPPSGGRTP